MMMAPSGMVVPAGGRAVVAGAAGRVVGLVVGTLDGLEDDDALEELDVVAPSLALAAAGAFGPDPPEQAPVASSATRRRPARPSWPGARARSPRELFSDRPLVVPVFPPPAGPGGEPEPTGGDDREQHPDGDGDVHLGHGGGRAGGRTVAQGEVLVAGRFGGRGGRRRGLLGP